MSLLAIIPTMLAHWVYYLFSWASLAYLLCLYLLLCPWAYWLLFLPRWPIEFITTFLGLFNPFILSLPLIVSMGLLAVIPTTLGHWAYDLFFWASSAHLLYLYPLFHGSANYHSYHIGPLNILPYFYHLYSFFLSFSLFLGFFCHWAFWQK